MSADRFCEHCGVDLGLHPSKEQTDDVSECEAAEARADLIEAFWGAVLGAHQ